MDRLDTLVLVSALAAVASVSVAAGLRAAVADAPPARPVAATAPSGLVIRDMLEPRFARAGVDPDAAPATLRVRAAGGGRVVGFTAATAYPRRDGRCDYAAWLDVTGTQIGDALHLRRWVDRSDATGAAQVFVSVRIEHPAEDGTAPSMETRRGWIELELDDLRTGGLVADLPAEDSAVVRVVGPAGRPLPGVLVAVDQESQMPLGFATQLATTDADGAARVSGLDPSKRWFARLPGGAARWTEPLRTPIDLAAGVARFELSQFPSESALTSFRVRMPFPGASLRVTSVTPRGAAGLRATPVQPWIGPGRGPDAEVWLAWNRDPGAEPVPGTIAFEGLLPVEVADLRAPGTVTDLRPLPQAAREAASPR
jgi:hypothetical protein